MSASIVRNPVNVPRVLVCDDNQLIAAGWAAMLKDAGYEVIGPAFTAEKALEMAYQDLPDVAILDIGLGGCLDGISVAAELAPLGTSVIFVTGDYTRAAVEGREYATDILIKPLISSTVLTSVAKAVEEKHG